MRTASLVTESLRDFTKKALEEAASSASIDFLKSLERCRTQAGRHRGAGATRGYPLESAHGGRIWQGSRSIRPDLPRRVRPGRRSPAGNASTMSASATSSPNMATQARAVLGSAAARNTSDEGVLNLDDPKVLQIPPLTARWARRWQLVQANSARAPISRTPSTRCNQHYL